MSFTRYVYYCALAGGWGAFVGWGLIELTGSGGTSNLAGVALVGAILGSMICGALSVFTTLLNGSIKQLPRKAGPAFVGGMVCGGIATSVAQISFQVGVPRFFAWMLMGIGIGLVEGLFEQSRTKLRNGIIGGAIGGMLGGLLFDPIFGFVGSTFPSLAIGFVIVGLFIGALIGLVQVILKQAWIVVVDGYRPGRQLILSTPVTILGRGDQLSLPFLGISNADVEQEHLKIICQSNGGYFVEDNNSRLGTFLNGQRITGPTPLKHKDLIRFGTNHIEFNVSRSAEGGIPESGPGNAPSANVANPPVPPPPPNASLKPRVSIPARPALPLDAKPAEVTMPPHGTPAAPSLPRRPETSSAPPPPPPRPGMPPAPPLPPVPHPAPVVARPGMPALPPAPPASVPPLPSLRKSPPSPPLKSPSPPPAGYLCDSAKTRGEGGNLEVAVFSPPQVARGEAVLIQVFCYVIGLSQEAKEQAVEFDEDAVRRGVTTLTMPVRRDERLQFHLTAIKLKIKEPIRELRWKDVTNSVQYEVQVPKAFSLDSLVGTVLVSRENVPLGRIGFKISVVSKHSETQTRDAVPVGESTTRFRKAFVSYSSKDREAVLHRVQMLRPPFSNIDAFQDVLGLEPGDVWTDELYNQINECDLFLLFWSSNAKASEWVQREWKHALKRQGPDNRLPPTMLPVIIEGPPPVSPPEELNHLHFNDYLLYLTEK